MWDNCARILYQKSDEELEPHLPKLFEWTSDLNWPGAQIILDRLFVFSAKKLKQPLSEYLYYCLTLEHEEQMYLTRNLSQLIEREDLRKFLDKEVISTLQRHSETELD